IDLIVHFRLPRANGHRLQARSTDGIEEWTAAVERIPDNQIDALAQPGQKPLEKPPRGRHLALSRLKPLPSDDEGNLAADPTQSHRLVVILLDGPLLSLRVHHRFLADLALPAVDFFTLE